MVCQCTPPRWAALSHEEQASFGNGCGPAWLPVWLSGLINRYLFGWLYEAKCRRHDFAYARGGSEADRKRADLGFYHAMVRDAARFGDNSTCKELAALAVAGCFYSLVRAFGWLRFAYGPYRPLTELVAEERP